jgi:hypothetical protein
LNDKDADNPEVNNLSATERKWQIRSTQVAILVTLIGLVAGGAKYLSQRSESLKAEAENAKVRAENDKRESQKPFLEKQLNTCFDVVGIVGSLAAENEPGIVVKPEQHAKALDQFWVHYHGTLSVVENDRVESAMVEIGTQLRQCERSHEKCDLQNNANRLAHACRDLMRKGWDITDIQYNQ